MDIPGVTYSSDSHVKVVDANYDNAQMSQEDFLKVLLAELQWQDPLKAEDISDFIDNTVKLKELESYDTFQKSVDELLSANQANALLTASSLIGENVRYEGDQTYVKNGIGYADIKLDASADTVKIDILDNSGTIVESKTLYNLQGGVDYPLSIENSSLPDGYYTVSVQATSNGDSVNASVVSEAFITGVEKNSDGTIVLNTDTFSIENSNLVGIGG